MASTRHFGKINGGSEKEERDRREKSGLELEVKWNKWERLKDGGYNGWKMSD